MWTCRVQPPASTIAIVYKPHTSGTSWFPAILTHESSGARTSSSVVGKPPFDPGAWVRILNGSPQIAATQRPANTTKGSEPLGSATTAHSPDVVSRLVAP